MKLQEGNVFCCTCLSVQGGPYVNTIHGQCQVTWVDPADMLKLFHSEPCSKPPTPTLTPYGYLLNSDSQITPGHVQPNTKKKILWLHCIGQLQPQEIVPFFCQENIWFMQEKTLIINLLQCKLVINVHNIFLSHNIHKKVYYLWVSKGK